jgi:hypothetical protein
VIQSWAFVVNSYDHCVSNKVVNGSQCRIVWHVDDVKISHVDHSVVTDIIEKLSNEFGRRHH